VRFLEQRTSYARLPPERFEEVQAACRGKFHLRTRGLERLPPRSGQLEPIRSSIETRRKIQNRVDLPRIDCLENQLVED